MEFAEALRSKLNYFDELENVSSNFYSPNMNVSNSNFLPLLKRLDECISYIEDNPQYAESSVYLLKFRQLQVLQRALPVSVSLPSLCLTERRVGYSSYACTNSYIVSRIYREISIL
jgi:hypothetical protein